MMADGWCRANTTQVAVSPVDYHVFLGVTERAMRYALANVGPVAVAFDASHPSIVFYSSGEDGVWPMTSPTSPIFLPLNCVHLIPQSFTGARGVPMHTTGLGKRKLGVFVGFLGEGRTGVVSCFFDLGRGGFHGFESLCPPPPTTVPPPPTAFVLHMQASTTSPSVRTPCKAWTTPCCWWATAGMRGRTTGSWRIAGCVLQYRHQ